MKDWAGPPSLSAVAQRPQGPGSCVVAASPEDGASDSFCVLLVVLIVKSAYPSCIAMVVTSND